MIGAYLIDGFTAALSRYLTQAFKHHRDPSLADLVNALDPQTVFSTPVVYNSLARPLQEVGDISSLLWPHIYRCIYLNSSVERSTGARQPDLEDARLYTIRSE